MTDPTSRSDEPDQAPRSLSRSRIRDLLDGHDLSPSRALGQNFLCDGGTIDKIVRLADVGPGDRVIEIGPGLGSLTIGLCRAGASVVSIEVDRYLIPVLREVVGPFERDGRLRIVEGDVREVDWDDVLASHAANLDGDGNGDGGVDAIGHAGADEWAVVANLPYNIATPLILDLLVEQPRLTRWVVMVQREAGERLVADPGSKIYGIPSVLLSYHASARIVGSVGAELFLPRPKVESVLVRIDRHPAPIVDGDYERIATLVRAGFGQRRKMLRRSLADHIDADGFAAADIEPTARPEEIGIEGWSRLATLGS